jgi:hypothetical protein
MLVVILDDGRLVDHPAYLTPETRDPFSNEYLAYTDSASYAVQDEDMARWYSIATIQRLGDSHPDGGPFTQDQLRTMHMLNTPMRNVQELVRLANYAAMFGHIAVLHFLEDRYILPDVDGANAAAVEGQENALEFLAARGILPDNRAALRGQLNELQLLADLSMLPATDEVRQMFISQAARIGGRLTGLRHSVADARRAANINADIYGIQVK